MCIILAQVQHVNATKIFTCFTEDQRRQFLVYSNEVETDEDDNVMILPVPNPDSVIFVNLSKYSKLFDDLEANFIKSRRPSYNMTASLSRSAAIGDSLERPRLVVHDVGSYSASIVPSVNDFDRIDTTHFTLPHDLETILRSTYDSQFGFIVCKLRRGNHKYHPFAYSHIKHDKNLLFIPTLHYHPHAFGLAKTHDADWDHIIYSVGTDLDTTSYDEYAFSPKDSIKYSKLPNDIHWIRHQRLKRWTKHGTGKNRDLWMAGNVMDPIRQSRPRTPSPSSQAQQAQQRTRAQQYEFPMTENGRKLLQKYFGSSM
jgi:hypothetical protein